MKSITFTFDGVFPSLNQYSDAERTNRHKAATMKRNNTEQVQWVARGAEPVPDNAYPVTVELDYYLPNKRTDPDNIVFAKKFILDGLQAAGVIRNDGWNEIAGFRERWHVDKCRPRVEVTLISERN